MKWGASALLATRGGGPVLTVEWDRDALRYCLAENRKGRPTLIAAGSQSLQGSTDAEIETQAAVALRELIADRQAARATVIVAAERTAVEWEPLDLPPLGDAELPGIVANQVEQRFPSLGDNAAIDYFQIRKTSGEPLIVGVALSGDQRSRIDRILKSAGIEADQILLRGVAAAALVRRTGQGTSAIVVDGGATSFELTVVEEGQAILCRTVRLPDDPRQPESIVRLIQELRRTQAALKTDWVRTDEPRRIVLIGGEGEWQAVRAVVHTELAQPVVVIDPFEVAGIEPPASLSRRGGFAGLIGGQLDAFEGASQPVDFLHTKRPAPPKNRRRPAMIAGAAAAVLLAGLAYMIYSEFADIDDTNAQLKAEISELDATAKKGERRQAIASAVSAWDEASVNWLETLQQFSKSFPASGDIVLSRITMGPSRDGGGTITFQGMARNAAVVQAMEQAVRQAGHDVETPKLQERVQDKAYPWQFDATVTIAGKEPPEPAKGARR